MQKGQEREAEGHKRDNLMDFVLLVHHSASELEVPQILIGHVTLLPFYSPGILVCLAITRQANSQGESTRVTGRKPFYAPVFFALFLRVSALYNTL